MLKNVHSVSMTDKKTGVLSVSVLRLHLTISEVNDARGPCLPTICAGEQRSTHTYTRKKSLVCSKNLYFIVRFKAGTLLQVELCSLKKGICKLWLCQTCYWLRKLRGKGHQAVKGLWYSCDSRVQEYINTSTAMSKYYVQYFKIDYQETLITCKNKHTYSFTKLPRTMFIFYMIYNE